MVILVFMTFFDWCCSRALLVVVDVGEQQVKSFKGGSEPASPVEWILSFAESNQSLIVAHYTVVVGGEQVKY